MPTTTINELRDALGLGLGIVTRIWDYKGKDWMFSVCAEDIDNDGVVEVIASSREGRVCLLSATGDLRWERVVGAKTWVGTVVAIAPTKVDGKDIPARIIVGTRDGKIYVLDKDGKTIGKDGQVFAFDNDGRAIEPEQEQEAYWYNTGYVIRQLYVDPICPKTIIFGSEDRCVYVLDYKTGELLWKYQTNGWVRAVFSCDIDNDGKAEILAGSVDKHLYVFDEQGHLLAQYNMGQPVQRIFATDVDNDGDIEILVGTDGKDLAALSYHQDEIAPSGRLQKKWRTTFDNRILSLCVTDLDNDGKSEIVAGSEDKHIHILDEHGRTIWRHNHKFRIFSLYPYDIDNDHIPELLVASENDRVRAMRIRLHKGLVRKIHKYYQRLEESEPPFLNSLNTDQRDLLQDIVRVNVKEQVSLELAKQLMDAGEYNRALSMLLKLQQNKVELLVHKDDVGHLRRVCFRHVAGDPKCEIIVSNTEGKVQAFNESGQPTWSVHLDDHIVDMQTGFIDHREQEEIVVCSSDHRVYILGGTRKLTQRDIHLDAWMSSVCVTVPDKQSQAEIIVGSEENKLYIIRDSLETPETIKTPEGIRVVRAHASSKADEPEIIAASLGNRVYAFTRSGKMLWNHETRDRIPTLCIMDINGDGNVEVLVGSEDRNIHILDNAGQLLWRFYMPHSVLSIDAADLDQDGRVEIIVGCADGYLHVLSSEGDLLWKYDVGDRIHSVRVGDIDGDGNMEIAIGSEDELNLLRIVNQQQVSTLIYQWWTALNQQQSARQVIDALLKDPDAFLRAFALKKSAEQPLTAKDFDSFEKYVKDESIEMRKTLVGVVMAHYMENITKARQILLQLSMDIDLDVKNAFVENILILMKYDWELGFYYLIRFLDHPDRCVRRMVVRKLYQLIDTPVEGTKDKHREIFDLLLYAAQDKESEWIRQEAARSLAHYLNRYQRGLIIYVHLFIVKEIQPSILERIAYAATIHAVKHYIDAVVPMLSGLNAENALQRTQQVVKALEKASDTLYGRDLRLLYAELHRLLAIDAIDDIAHYQCSLDANQFPTHNEFAAILLNVFNKLNTISRTLKIYLMRVSVPDRLSSLLETITVIEKVSGYVEEQYASSVLGEPITRLPDRKLFTLLLKKWQNMVMEQLIRLRGKSELQAELQTKYTRYEQQVGIWFTVSNIGRSSATNVKITLLYSEHFDVVKTKSYEIETILAQEEVTCEFIIKPHAAVLDLHLELVYDDVEDAAIREVFGDRLELIESRQEFHSIPNLYSTGIPTHDSKMFYGRESEMAFLKDNLARDAKTVIVLYGQRRSGKTTLLLQLINAFAHDKHIPVLIDMQRVTYHITISSFLYKVALFIAQAMQKKAISICQPDAADFKLEPTSAFDAFLDTVEDLLTGQKLILMVDEFEILEEQVVRGKLDSEIFEYLRNILQHRQNINFLFSGTHKITEYTKWYRSVFFNIARHYPLSQLTPQGAIDLIQKPVDGFLEYEPLTVKKIRQLTADQPYLIHLMCRAIVDYCNENRKSYAAINDINTVIRDVMQTGQFHFDWLWDQISPEDRMALAVIAEGEKYDGRWLSMIEIEEIYRYHSIHFTHEYLKISLKTLLDADLIENESSNDSDSSYDGIRFRIPVGLTREWLHKEKPLELVRKELGG
jgi:outer membrane protein assembly factor BamB/energy-coupling factor transporter ATP-binding protein EcfA2